VYLEEIMGSAAATDPLPMLVLIHGLGDRPARGWLPLQLPKAVRVIMPQAPLPHGDGFAWSRARASEMDGPSGAQLAQDLARGADQIAAALSVLRAKRPTIGVPMIGGFSQGGMLSYALAVRHPSASALVIPISGLLPRSLWPAAMPSPHSMPSSAMPRIRALHGTADTVVPIDPARAVVQHLAQQGFDATLTEQLGTAHHISSEMRAHIDTWLSEAL
jgi:phospholipase/carboxylesterase